MVQKKEDQETDAQKKERERKEREAQEVKEGGSKADYPKIERKSDVDAGVPEKFSTPFADPSIPGRPRPGEPWGAPAHTGIPNPPNPPMHNDTDIKSETNLDTLQRQLAESRAKADELQKELQALKEPQPQYTMQPEVPNRQFFGPDEGPKAKPQPDPKDSKGGKPNMKPETWNEKTYVLLSDHHMSDRVLERGTLVGKGTPYPLTNRPSNAMEETDTPQPTKEKRELRHVEPPR